MKNRVKIIWIVLFIGLFSNPYPCLAQNEWDKAVLESANTAKDVNYLTQDEKDIIFYTNLARMNGPLFIETYLKDYLEKNNIRNDKWVSSLKKDLKNTSFLAPLKPQQDLYEAAKKHAQQSGKTGRTGHANFNERNGELMKKYNGIGENCDYGAAAGLTIVMNLLIDKNVANLGHRKNMLHADFKYTGASIQKHKKYGFNGVIIYGEAIKSKIKSRSNAF